MLTKIQEKTFKNKWFWLIFIALVLFGLYIQQLSPEQHTLVCQTYCNYFEEKVGTAIDNTLATFGVSKRTAATTSAPASAPTATTTHSSVPLDVALKSTIRNYFCDHSSTQPGDLAHWHTPTASEWAIAIPGALLLSLSTAIVLPKTASRQDVTDRVSEAARPAPPRDVVAPPGALVQDRFGVLSRYPEIAVTTRQLRIAITYAVLSGLATVLLKPTFVITPAPAAETLNANLLHLVGVLGAAIVASVWGTYTFSRAQISTFFLASRLGFGAIFAAGLVSAAISLPYQVLRPPALSPMTESQVLTLLGVRLLAIPLLSMAAFAVFRPLLRSIPDR